MLTIEVMGGLGNQLFQIFAVMAYSLRHNIPFYFERSRPSRGDRPFYWDTMFRNIASSLRDKRNIPILKEPHFHYTEIPLVNKHFKLYGYFQSYKYFKDQQQLIYNTLDVSSMRKELKRKDRHKVSMHFRLGDYKAIQQHHPIMKADYYSSALSRLSKDTNKKDWTVLYFYEQQDKTQVENTIHTLKKIYPEMSFEPISQHYTDWQQMLIMSGCGHNIIANSTFSWWGSYLNDSIHNTYYPSKWFGPAQGDKKMDDLFPPHWIKIPC